MSELPQAQVFDRRICDLGEGAFWHPERRQFFWFDITGRRLMSREHGDNQHWQFEQSVSAAGWIDADTLLIAASDHLLHFDIATGTTTPIAPLDCAAGRLRPNDGRADPWGGFWIGTMGHAAESQAGAIWRYYRGEMRRLFDKITIPNAICFAPDAGFACFTDTPGRIVYRQRLEATQGWPIGDPEPWLDLRAAARNPDGAVLDAQGRLWLAEWGSHRVAIYDRQAQFSGAVAVGAPHASCPAFGGDNLSVLHITTARQGMDTEALSKAPEAGMTYAVDLSAHACHGQAEHQVIL
ncbi:SMP-30/gluconolactonase/LRE family protein [Roseovarius mucosus]|uniref:SMP-30/gluconolactonase/LRE family protein n=1 Tax=Roseovarius mucosus TaxID=215743 RepID=UPI003F7138DB